ncbi:acyltransferase [Vibrio sp. ZSDZ65]|uniref:Acyltransferase n=1 Tax=Vibrio qingdaonensis TaxID=2829491 RepID=A0A9X3HX18_9VIBR|nr:acyltransferase [Vibrio qingdaonensis]MCW8347255.1 acyltransferase [Vibrio qingdaonensis]
MLSNLRLLINSLLVILNTAVTAVVVSTLSIIKLILPLHPVQKTMTSLANKQMWVWATVNLWLLNVNNNIDWQIEGGEELTPEQWYMLLSNHLSWTDIVIISSVMKDRMPMCKFLLKQSLLYVPFVGLACWGLDMPFMKRHSQAYLVKHPERRNDDFNAIKKACKKFQHVPTTMISFVEGTRYSPEKVQTGKTPYRHLLKPKTGGVAFTLNAMNQLLDGVVDITLAYPENRESPFEDLLKGRLTKVVVKIEVYPMDENLNGDYFKDKAFKRRFHHWLNALWKRKDETLESIYQNNGLK